MHKQKILSSPSGIGEVVEDEVAVEVVGVVVIDEVAVEAVEVVVAGVLTV